jgi:hypothetical protein
VFLLLIGDGWNNIMYDYVRNSSVMVGPILYFISLMLIGNLILIRLFSAILLKNFQNEKKEEEIAEIEEISKS